MTHSREWHYVDTVVDVLVKEHEGGAIGRADVTRAVGSVVDAVATTGTQLNQLELDALVVEELLGIGEDLDEDHRIAVCLD